MSTQNVQSNISSDNSICPKGLETLYGQKVRKLRQKSKNTVSYLERKIQTRFGKGKWEQREEKKYLRFIHRNKTRMQDSLAKKKYNIFIRMSEYVQTRDRSQCTSHHQKMMKKYNSIQQILLQFEGFLLNLRPQKSPQEPIKFEKSQQINSQGNNYKVQKEKSTIDKSIYELQQNQHQDNKIAQQSQQRNSQLSVFDLLQSRIDEQEFLKLITRKQE